MRREAERRGKPQPRVELGEPDPANRPQLAAETPPDPDAVNDWLSHIAAGRISVRCGQVKVTKWRKWKNPQIDGGSLLPANRSPLTRAYAWDRDLWDFSRGRDWPRRSAKAP